MIYIRGINPTNNRRVFYRGQLGPKTTSWTEKLIQAMDLKSTTNAQNILNTLNTLNMSITNYEVITDNTLNSTVLQQQALILKNKTTKPII